MKIYIGHSKGFDYANELYAPIKKSAIFKKHEFILPHDNDNHKNSREFYKGIDLIIAECSYPATGLGIELGFAYDDNKPIYCLYKKGMKISGSIKVITKNIYQYNDIEEMLEIIAKIIKNEHL